MLQLKLDNTMDSIKSRRSRRRKQRV